MLDVHAIPEPRPADHPEGCACPACRPDPVPGPVPAPAPGDVVLAPVPPRHGTRGRPAPTPCLVIDVAESEDGPRLVLVPGAPARGRPARRADLYAAADDLVAVSGLRGPHVFIATRPVVVPLGRDRGCAGAGTRVVILGRLGGGALGRLEAPRPRGARDASRAAVPDAQSGGPCSTRS